jgi:hypothetical protein
MSGEYAGDQEVHHASSQPSADSVGTGRAAPKVFESGYEQLFSKMRTLCLTDIVCQFLYNGCHMGQRFDS